MTMLIVKICGNDKPGPIESWTIEMIPRVDRSMADVPASDFVWPYKCHFGDCTNRPIKLANPSEIAMTNAPASMAPGQELQKKKIKQQIDKQ